MLSKLQQIGIAIFRFMDETNYEGLHPVVEAQLLARRLAISEVPGSNPGKGESFSGEFEYHSHICNGLSGQDL